ncbi:P-loop ATPase, Sll1717 family [Chromobacterium subtsugae]|uniref:P-loop ATPase, Sll1717 family n=1 Tax=Chromobacterium subtsugae TaxID=251747 RepID=UPI000B13DA6C|nr:hypothetical protein [Chromobacterium subtsugae]
MGIFNNIKNNTGNTKQTAPIKHRTTKNFFLGYPEAEAEAHNNSQIPFTTLYTNINLIENLDDSRFILVGKKGTGKSAFAKYIESNNIANFFCKTLRKNDLDIDGIVSACGKDFDYESVSRWVLSVQMLKLISNSQSLDHKEQENIKKFLEINSGYVDFDKYSIKAISNQKDIKIDISPLKSILKIIGGEQKKLDQEKPSFLQVLPSLEELLSKILTEEKCRESQNSYLIILDDLDHGFNAKNSTHIANGYSLITAARNFNNEICREGNAKTILLMRDDIIRRIESHEAGSAKAISSYAYKIKWHDNNLKGEAEKFNKLNEFIEKRLKHNFVKNNIQKIIKPAVI